MSATLIADLARLLGMTVSSGGHALLLDFSERYGGCRHVLVDGPPPVYEDRCTGHCADVRDALARAAAYLEEVS